MAAPARLILAGLVLSGQAAAGSSYPIGLVHKPAELKDCPVGYSVVVNYNPGTGWPYEAWCYSSEVQPRPVNPQKRRRGSAKTPTGAR